MTLFVSPTNTKRFNLYHLQENESYIQDFYGECTFFDYHSNEDRHGEKGKFYICSKTIVYEADNKSVPLYKYRFESFLGKPEFTTENITFKISKITAIKCNGSNPPEPFRIIDDLKDRVQIKPSYETVKNLSEWVSFLYDSSSKKGFYDLEDRLMSMIIEKFNKKAFNLSLIDSMSQKPILDGPSVLARTILPLNSIYGYFFMTDEKIYFEPFHNLTGKTVEKIRIDKIKQLFKRRYELRQIGLEVGAEDKSLYLTFQNESTRNRVYSQLVKRVSEECVRIDQLQNITLLWQTKELSNFQYIMHLNRAGNRSFNDLSQYPIFPWVITDYTSKEIDLKNPAIYRDLSKPVGALNPTRLEGLISRYESMQEPRFMYGSHYSTPGYVIGYLVRKKPEYMLKLQSGRFDKPDRLFKSIEDDWNNVMDNPTSLKQLIPEFYQNDSCFLRNYQNLDLGVRQNKERVEDVKLPPWAQSSPDKYLQINREAFQSEYVSANLHKWIDLIFGYKQRGHEAAKALNVFHPLTYQGFIDIQSIKDPVDKIGWKCQINEFGQCPKQIFKIPHPSRDSVKPLQLDEGLLDQLEGVEIQDKYVPPPVTTANHSLEVSNLYSNGVPKVKTVLSMGKESDIKVQEIPKAHKSLISRAIHLSSKPNSLVTISHDGFLKIFDVYEKVCTKSFKICDFSLSSIVPLKQDQIFAIGSWDSNVYLFNIVYGSRSKPFPAHHNSISDLVYMNRHKKLVTASWDCSIKMFRYVGNVLDNQEQFYDHQNQLSTLAVSKEENMIAFGDIQGNVLCVSIDEKEILYNFNMNSQRIMRAKFIETNLIVAAETEMRLVDIVGSPIASHMVNKSNGTINDIYLDGEHVFIVTSAKQLILYDALQQEKVGNFFNDFTFSTKDRLPNDKQISTITSGNDGLFIAVLTSTGSIYVLRS